MADRPIVEVSVSADGIRALSDALKREADGKELRKELAKNMRQALMPYAERAKTGIMSMSSTGRSANPGLRSGIAKKIRPEVKLGGQWSGARVKAKKTPGLRGFANAPKRTNRRGGGWRTQSWGNGVWRTQAGKTKWFDHALEGAGPQARQAVHEAMEAMARRIADRAGQG